MRGLHSGPREPRSGPVQQKVRVLLSEQGVDDHDEGGVVGHLQLEIFQKYKNISAI